MTTNPHPHAIHVPDKGAQGCLAVCIVVGACIAVAAMWCVIEFFVAVLS